ncbi:DUF6445 family protein [Undibacterium cyanobacteriorum]|uniref:DUF6445 family protein n=1 Tax=Undibacterium cyanobacteriorum TaxID=3073561 RepID=A0ABY9RHH8_9BURK|nr:DUF6445 family protein [Undibacterium sp. 20NA77.5]WMW80642.1 DUF6445 family protein [Undibacterium sp. 20NA77.5]
MQTAPPLPLFNPQASVSVQVIPDLGAMSAVAGKGKQEVCVVVDDFLLNPEEVVEHARRQRQQFRYDVDNYFPGVEMDMGRTFALQMEQYFMLHLRSHFQVRRNLGCACRMSMTTLSAAELKPLQRLCHRDAEVLPLGMGIAASVVYLFTDASLGGTSFFRPRGPLDETRRFLQRAEHADHTWLNDELQQAPAYCYQSNPRFALTHTVEAKWNRAIFYEGTVFHAAHISDPTRLSAEVDHARLCLNAFFRFKKQAGAA